MKLCLGAEKNQYHLWPRKMHIAVQLAKFNKFDLFFGNSANSEVKFASILLFYIIRKWSSCRHCFCNDVLYWSREFCEISRNFEILLKKKNPLYSNSTVYTPFWTTKLTWMKSIVLIFGITKIGKILNLLHSRNFMDQNGANM